jgi:hypothetical protein
MIPITISFISWIVFSVYCGYVEALYFHYRSLNAEKDPQHFDVHVTFNIQRVAALIPIFFSSYFLPSIVLIFSCMLVFPFFHDGQYYTTRNSRNSMIYIKRWKDYGNGSAWLDFTWKQRLLMLVLGLLFFSVSLILHTMYDGFYNGQ